MNKKQNSSRRVLAQLQNQTKKGFAAVANTTRETNTAIFGSEIVNLEAMNTQNRDSIVGAIAELMGYAISVQDQVNKLQEQVNGNTTDAMPAELMTLLGMAKALEAQGLDLADIAEAVSMNEDDSEMGEDEHGDEEYNEGEEDEVVGGLDYSQLFLDALYREPQPVEEPVEETAEVVEEQPMVEEPVAVEDETLGEEPMVGSIEEPMLEEAEAPVVEITEEPVAEEQSVVEEAQADVDTMQQDAPVEMDSPEMVEEQPMVDDPQPEPAAEPAAEPEVVQPAEPVAQEVPTETVQEASVEVEQPVTETPAEAPATTEASQ